MYRKSVSALIRNKNQEFLLVNLKSFEERYFTIPGGGIHEEETLGEAVYREIKEEVNIDRDSLNLVGKSITVLINISTERLNYRVMEKSMWVQKDTYSAFFL